MEIVDAVDIYFSFSLKRTDKLKSIIETGISNNTESKKLNLNDYVILVELNIKIF